MSTKRLLPLAIASILVALNVHPKPAIAQNEPQTSDPKGCSHIEITGLKPGVGKLMIAAYSAPEQFFKQRAWGQIADVAGERVTIAVCGFAGKELAFTAFQDLNGNGKMDTNAFGIPSEPYGASGNPSKFGPPTFADTKVTLTAGAVIRFSM